MDAGAYFRGFRTGGAKASGAGFCIAKPMVGIKTGAAQSSAERIQLPRSAPLVQVHGYVFHVTFEVAQSTPVGADEINVDERSVGQIVINETKGGAGTFSHKWSDAQCSLKASFRP